MKDQGKILVIMPVYNKEEFLEYAIESVLQQSYKDIHLVVIDDKSTDNSLDIINKYRGDQRVTILENEENKGCYYTRNRGLDYIEKTGASFFTIHDADDRSSITRFKKILPYFNDQPLLGIKTTYLRVDTDGRPVFNNLGDKDIYASEGIAIYRSKVFNILGYYDNTRFSGDTDYWWRLQRFCYMNPDWKVAQDDRVLYLATVHENNLTKEYKIQDRGWYFDKIRKEITEMSSKNEYKRFKFE